MDAKRLADKYIAPDGGPPQKPKPGHAMSKEKAGAVSCLAFFIGAHHPGETHGSWKAAQAMAALAVLTGMPEAKLREAAGWK
jgi:hypothetical protein